MSSSEKAVKLLRMLAMPPYEHRLSDLAEAVDCVKSGTHKLLAVLIAQGVAEQTHDKRYRLGVGAYLIGKSYEENVGVWRMFKPYLEKLRNATRENTSFGTWLPAGPTVLYRVESPEFIRVAGRTATVRPVNASAISKTLAAHADPEFMRDWIARHPLERYTPKTIVDTDELFEEYRKIREQGYAVSDGEFSEDAMGIGAPIRSKTGNVWAAISMGAPKFRVPEEKLREYIRLITETAAQVSAL